MASVHFVPVSTGARTATATLTLRESAVLTASYVATTDDVHTVGWDYVLFRIVYTKGDETSAEFKVELYDGANWTSPGRKEAPSGGFAAVTEDDMQATASATIILPAVLVVGHQKARLVAKATGGTPTGTLAVTATAGISIAARGA